MFSLSLSFGNLPVNFSCKVKAPLVTFVVANTENQHLLFSSFFQVVAENLMHPYVNLILGFPKEFRAIPP